DPDVAGLPGGAGDHERRAGDRREPRRGHVGGGADRVGAGLDTGEDRPADPGVPRVLAFAARTAFTAERSPQRRRGRREPPKHCCPTPPRIRSRGWVGQPVIPVAVLCALCASAVNQIKRPRRAAPSPAPPPATSGLPPPRRARRAWSAAPARSPRACRWGRARRAPGRASPPAGSAPP